MNPPVLDPQKQAESIELANLLTCEVITELGTQEQWLEWVYNKKTDAIKLSLCSKKNGPVAIDFLTGKKAHRMQFGGGKGQPLVRAMGIRKDETSKKVEENSELDGNQQNQQNQSANNTSLPTILDATAGMGGDSFVLASLGFKVQMVERSAIVAALLNDALKRAQAQLETQAAEVQQSINNLSLVNADSAQFLIHNQPNVDVVYMDPMYPEKKKKAAAKKEMQALQQLVGPDLDSAKLLDAALNTAKTRVVVKRPKGAPPVQSLAYDIEPSIHISSPNTRYDIYVIKALKAAGKI